MKVCFTFEEQAFMGGYNPENGRIAMIMTLTEELPYMGDELTAETARSTLAKLHTMTDTEFETMLFVNVFE